MNAAAKHAFRMAWDYETTSAGVGYEHLENGLSYRHFSGDAFLAEDEDDDEESDTLYWTGSEGEYTDGEEATDAQDEHLEDGPHVVVRRGLGGAKGAQDAEDTKSAKGAMKKPALKVAIIQRMMPTL